MNAVIYARYSSHGQTEQSIEGQLRDCYSYAERQEYNVVGEYIDRALTGRNDDRPSFQRMISDSAKKQFDYIIVYKLDRFARNRYDSAIYKHKLRDNNVKVLSAMENIGDAPEHILLEALLEATAEWYSRDLSQKVKRGLKESAIKGNYTGGIPLIGYKVIDKKVVIDEDKAHIIRYAFEQYANGVSKKEILAALTQKGITNYNGKPMGLSCFQYALKNKKYIGITVFNGVEYKNTYPPIIDADIFMRVQERLAQVSHAPAVTKAREEYLLQGKAYCGYCGTRLVGECGTGRGGNKYYYYACGQKKKLHTCKKNNEKKDYIEWYVVEQTLEYVLSPARMEIIADAIVDIYDKEFNNGRIHEMEKRLAKIERDIDRSFAIMLESNSKAIIKRSEESIEHLELQKIDLEIDLLKLRIANGIRYTRNDVLLWLKTFTVGDLFDLEFRKRIIDSFINSIYLYDDKLVVYYNIKGGKQVSFMDMCENVGDTAQESDINNNNMVRISNDTASHKSLQA